MLSGTGLLPEQTVYKKRKPYLKIGKAQTVDKRVFGVNRRAAWEQKSKERGSSRENADL